MPTLLQVGDRCEVDPGGKRGEVKFVGKVDTLAAGYWIGVQYDEPVGKHDGVYGTFLLISIFQLQHWQQGEFFQIVSTAKMLFVCAE